MTLTVEQSRALIDAIFVADSADRLSELRRRTFAPLAILGGVALLVGAIAALLAGAAFSSA